jgi:hypothetical protein
MKILKLKFYTILILVFFSCVNSVSASVVFNEVSLSPTENRFIELYNTGSSAVDLTDWYIQRKTSTGATFGSLVSKTYFEGIEIKGGGYLVISKNSIDNTDIVVDSLTLTESNTIQIKNSNQEVVDILEYGNIAEGKSTQKVSGDWVIGNITPGEANLGSNNNDDEEVENTVDDSNTQKSESVSVNNDQKNLPRIITAKIISPKIVFAGVPFIINSLVTTNKKETLAIGKYKWNFGDGFTKEDTNSSEFEHVYLYPGDYVLSLNYYERRSTTVDDSDRITIKVVPNEITISSIGDHTDSFIEIENKSNYEMVLDGFIIYAGMHYFKIPDGTVVLANKKVRFSKKVTGFAIEDLNMITITNKNGDTVTVYPSSLVKNTVKKVSSKIISLPSKETANIEKEVEELPIINLNNLEANALKSNGDLTSGYAYWGLGGIIFVGITSVLLLRRKKEEIGYLEDEIRAEDIKIIE